MKSQDRHLFRMSAAGPLLAAAVFAASCGSATYRGANGTAPEVSSDDAVTAGDSSSVASSEAPDSGPAAKKTPVATAKNPAASTDKSPSLPLADPGAMGPYSVGSLTRDLDASDYVEAKLYFPTNCPLKQLPATTLSGGFNDSYRSMEWLAEHLASHCFVVLAFTPTNRYAGSPDVWARGHMAALATIAQVEARADSPIHGRLEPGALGISGFSMGGGGTLKAVNQAGTKVRAAVAICAYDPDPVAVAVPTLFLTGTADIVASPGAIETAYRESATGAPKGFAKFAGMGHRDVAGNSSPHRNIARYLTAWYQVFLAGRPEYRTFLDGAELVKDRQSGSVFNQPGDYRYQK